MGGERHLLHLTDDGGGVIGLLPAGLGEVLLELLGDGAVDVLLEGGVATDPLVSEGLARLNREWRTN